MLALEGHMSASVRAKFRCLEVTKRYSHTTGPSSGLHPDTEPTDVFQYRVKLAPVYGSGKNGKPASEENKAFYASTPCGQIELETVSEGAAAAFVPGQAYLIDFTPADG